MIKRLRGVDLGAATWGDGSTLVVLLHAFPMDARMWSDTAPFLTQPAGGGAGRRVVALDFRGFGESRGTEPATNLKTLADDVAALLDDAGAATATVVGLSMGGYVALAFAQRHAARLAGLVLADTRAGADGPEGRRKRDEGIALVRSRGAAAFAEATVPKLLAPEAEDAVRTRISAVAAEQPPESVAAALAAMRDRPDRTGDLSAITCPTLIVVGALDTVTPPEESRKMAAAIPGARLVEIPGAGHLANLEASDAFNAAVASFLTSVSR